MLTRCCPPTAAGAEWEWESAGSGVHPRSLRSSRSGGWAASSWRLVGVLRSVPPPSRNLRREAQEAVWGGHCASSADRFKSYTSCPRTYSRMRAWPGGRASTGSIAIRERSVLRQVISSGRGWRTPPQATAPLGALTRRTHSAHSWRGHPQWGGDPMPQHPPRAHARKHTPRPIPASYRRDGASHDWRAPCSFLTHPPSPGNRAGPIAAG